VDAFEDMFRGSRSSLNTALHQIEADIKNYERVQLDETLPVSKVHDAIYRLNSSLNMAKRELTIYERCTSIAEQVTRIESGAK
jgi:hypothetical protein